MMTPSDIAGWLREFARLVAENRQRLTDLDAAIGDADHGTNLDRGMTAVLSGLAGPDGAEPIGALCKQVGMTLVSTVGGASGPLYGTFFLRFGGTAGDVDVLDLAGFTTAFRAGVDGVVARGKAEPGDKTMVDVLMPAVEILESGGSLAAATEAAENGRDNTTAMVAHKGRASYLGERSAGHQDPGATSAALLVRAAATTLT